MQAISVLLLCEKLPAGRNTPLETEGVLLAGSFFIPERACCKAIALDAGWF